MSICFSPAAKFLYIFCKFHDIFMEVWSVDIFFVLVNMFIDVRIGNCCFSTVGLYREIRCVSGDVS